MNIIELAENNKIIEIKVGSHLYGTHTTNSDIDHAGVFLPPKEFVLGLQRVEEVDLSIKDKNAAGKNTPDAIDRKLYEFRKFIKLALENNPNIIEQVFVNEENIIYCNDIGKALLAQQQLFPHLGLVQKFKGYAFSQKHKMIIRTDNYHELKNAFDYLKEYPEQKELLIELKNKFLPFMKFNQDYCRVGDLNLQKSIYVKKAVAMIEERLSKVGHRKELITQYGFDTKFASHLIRLLLEGKELLTQGNLHFPLADKETLLAIKQGQWCIKEILDYADQLEAEIDNIAKHSPLPNKPQIAEIEKFTIDILGDYICQK